MTGGNASIAALAALLADEPLPPEGLQMLRRGVQTYLRHEGRLSLDRALQLPSGTQFRRAQRDHYIAEALRLVNAPSDRARALELRRLLMTMASTRWRRWRALGGVPADTSALDAACFEALSRGRNPAAPAVPSERTLRKLAAAIR